MRQVYGQDAGILTEAADAPRGPAALNAVERDVLRAHVLAAVQSAPDDEPQRRAPLLAPFMTNATLLRVYNILAPLGVDERGGWPLQASLGRAVAALTGAPPPASMEDAQHWGNAMQRRVSHYSGRLRTKHSRPRSDAARNRLAADQEQLYICPYGGTPERPSERVFGRRLWRGVNRQEAVEFSTVDGL